MQKKWKLHEEKLSKLFHNVTNDFADDNRFFLPLDHFESLELPNLSNLKASIRRLAWTWLKKNRSFTKIENNENGRIKADKWFEVQNNEYEKIYKLKEKSLLLMFLAVSVTQCLYIVRLEEVGCGNGRYSFAKNCSLLRSWYMQQRGILRKPVPSPGVADLWRVGCFEIAHCISLKTRK